MDEQVNLLWKQAQTQIPLLVSESVNLYLSISAKSFQFPCPYWRDKTNQTNGERVRGFLGGKGSASEIQDEINKQIGEYKGEENLISVREFIKQRKIGVDCSGLVYNLTSLWQESLSGESLDTYITPSPGGNPTNPKRFRTSADTLTNQWNSSLVREISDVKPGDLIRMREGKHVILILYKASEMLLYIHSHERKPNDGVHLGVIEKIRGDAPISQAVWPEFMNDLGIVNSNNFNPDRGDGITRFHWWS